MYPVVHHRQEFILELDPRFLLLVGLVAFLLFHCGFLFLYYRWDRLLFDVIKAAYYFCVWWGCGLLGVSLARAVHFAFCGLFLLQLFQVDHELYFLFLFIRKPKFLRSFPPPRWRGPAIIRKRRQVMLLHSLIIRLLTKTKPPPQLLPSLLRLCIFKRPYILLYRQVRFLPAHGGLLLGLEGAHVEHFDEWDGFGRGGFLFAFHMLICYCPDIIFGLLILCIIRICYLLIVYLALIMIVFLFDWF